VSGSPPVELPEVAPMEPFAVAEQAADKGPEAVPNVRWQRTLYLTATAQAFSIFGFSFVTPFVPLYIQTMGIHGTAAITFWSAMLSGVVSIPMAISAPIWGVLADRYGRKIMVVRAAASACILVGLMGVASNVYELLVLRMFQGLLTGTVSASQALVASQSPKSRLGFSMGFMQTAVFVGTSLGPLAGGISAGLIGYRPSFGIAAGSLLMCAVLVGLFVTEHRPLTRTAEAPRLNIVQGMQAVIRIPALLPMAASIFAVQFAISQVLPILPRFIQILQGLGKGDTGEAAFTTGVIFAAAGAAAAISSTTTGWYSDRIGHRKVLTIAALLAACISVPQFFVNSTWQLLILRVLDGLCLGAMMPSASAIMAGLVPAEQRGAAYGVSGAFTSFGFAAGPLTSAAIVAVVGIRAVFLSAAVLLVLISGWVWRTAPKR
jgi:DHA1 family multidrug resistance protein-like MFS transporter